MDIIILAAEVQENGMDILVKYSIDKKPYSQMFSSSTSVEEIKNFIANRAERFIAASKLAIDLMQDVSVSMK